MLLDLFNLAKPRIQIDIKVTLALLQIFSTIQQYLRITAQTRHILAQVFYEFGQIQQGAAVLHRRLNACETIADEFLVRFIITAQFGNARARLVIIE